MKTIEVVAAVIVRDGRVFATQRGYGDFKDMWEFPGGKMEAGENREDALKREIREELAADISVDSFIDTVEYDYPKFHLILHCFLCSLETKEVHLLEHESSRWLSADELDSVDWLPADLSVIGQIKKLLT
ncbi:MAG: (deoxy)nucleoside triphosphate pyrophosphohydrolase [Bacteroidales bacterium]|nr:(deoxy)nucleoside triphosphate pyrophosphohydrolase [Bacteroidales bacterium]